MEANVYASAISWGRLLDATFHEEAEQSWFISGIPFNMFNAVIRAQFTPDEADTKIDELLRHFTQRNIPMVWLLSPSSRPTDLANRLEVRGLGGEDVGVGMAVDLLTLNDDRPLPEELTIKQVEDGAMLKTWLHVLSVGSGFPEAVEEQLFKLCDTHTFVHNPLVHYYLGFLNDKPVTTSTLFLAGGVAGIYNVATVPQARRRGVGSALTAAPLHAARVMGYHIGILQASQMGLGVYRRLGFREYCRFAFYFSRFPT